MPQCVGVAFKKVARSYWYYPDKLHIVEGDRVVVESSQGEQLGNVRIGIREVSPDDLPGPLMRVIRIATAEDCSREQENLSLARSSREICSKLIDHYQLPMKILQAEYTFDTKIFTVHFASEERVDFRALVRDLKSQLRCSVILHQVGVRDHASILGGLGQCGLTLCCSTFLTEFESVSVKLAKDQTLYQNPVKFSGMCGKLMCCLNYENDDNSMAMPNSPQIGAIVSTLRGEGRILEVDVLTQRATVQLSENREEVVFDITDLVNMKKDKCTKCKNRASARVV